MENQNLMKAMVSGATAVGVSYILFDRTNINIMGLPIPSEVFIFTAGAGSSYIANMAHDKVLPHIPQSEKLVKYESVALGVGASALTSAGVLKLSGVPNENLLKGSIAFAGSYMLSDYIHQQIMAVESDIEDLF